MELTLDADGAPVGPLDGQVVIKTGDEQQREVAIAVRGQVLPKIQVQPPRLFLQAGAQPRPVMLTAATPVRVLGVEIITDDGGAAPVSVVEPLPQPAKRVTIQVAPAAPGRSVAGEVRFFIADPDMPLVSVPFRIQDPVRVRAAADAARMLGVRVSPPEVDLGELGPGQEAETTILVSRAGPDSIDVRDVEVVPPGAVEARMEPIAGGQAARIVLHARGAARGPLEGVLRFRPRPGAEFVQMPFSGRVRGALAASPAALYFAAAGEAASVKVRRADGGRLRVRAIRDEAGALDFDLSRGTMTAAGSLSEATIVAKPRAGRAAGPLRGTVVVETDEPAGGTLTIPFFGAAP
jgi:hypothetical protein